MEKDAILQKALDTYGIHNQELKLFEEMAELQNAILKFRSDRGDLFDVITEIADVIIMCQQMALHFGAQEVEAEIHSKINRLNNRLSLPNNTYKTK